MQTRMRKQSTARCSACGQVVPPMPHSAVRHRGPVRSIRQPEPPASAAAWGMMVFVVILVAGLTMAMLTLFGSSTPGTTRIAAEEPVIPPSP